LVINIYLLLSFVDVFMGMMPMDFLGYFLHIGHNIRKIVISKLIYFFLPHYFLGLLFQLIGSLVLYNSGNNVPGSLRFNSFRPNAGDRLANCTTPREDGDGWEQTS
jgi:hypothetical protein